MVIVDSARLIVGGVDQSELKAEASGHVVSYRPFADTDPEEFCE